MTKDCNKKNAEQFHKLNNPACFEARRKVQRARSDRFYIDCFVGAKFGRQGLAGIAALPNLIAPCGDVSRAEAD